MRPRTTDFARRSRGTNHWCNGVVLADDENIFLIWLEMELNHPKPTELINKPIDKHNRCIRKPVIKTRSVKMERGESNKLFEFIKLENPKSVKLKCKPRLIQIA